MKNRKNGARRRISPLVLAVSAAYGCWNRNASAQYSWNTGTGDWSSMGSWTPMGPPTNGSTVNIINADATGRTVFYDYPAPSTLTLSNLTINDTGGGTNTLNWSTSYTLQSLEESIGDSNEFNVSGRGAVVQNSGMNAVTNNLYIGSYNGDTGGYTLSGSGELTSGTENVGNGGNATFIHSGGVNDVSGSFYMANNGGSSTYSLSSTGTLAVGGSEFIGNGGNATFVQSGGTNAPGTATELNTEYVGYSSSGTYIQTGGLNDMADLSEPYPASLIIGYGAVTGLYSLSGTGVLANLSLESIDASGTFIQSGGINSMADSTFEVDGLYSLSGTGTLGVIQGGMDNVDGTFIQSGGSHQVGDGGTTTNLSIGANGLYSLSGTGTLTVEEGQESVASGGTFSQSGGTNTVSEALDLTGTYTLSNNGQLTAGETPTGPYNDGEYIDGTFSQSGGTNSIVSSQSLYLGDQSGLHGTYLLSAGTLSVAGSVYVGGSSTAAEGTGSLSVSGSGSLTVDGTLQVWNSTGTHVTISGGTVTAGNTVNLATITQTGGTSSLGTLSGTGSISVGNSSGASASMTVTALTQNSVTVDSTGTLKMIGGASNNTINKLTINGSGIFDVTNGHFFIDYAGRADPISSIRRYLASGYAGGAWNGPGIDSSIAALPANSHYGVGYADGNDASESGIVPPDSVLVAYALLGDANLDGVVNGSDFTILTGNLGKSVTSSGQPVGWDDGDFFYTGTVTGSDFAALVGNLGKSASGADVILPASDYTAIDAFAAANGLMADVPEPASLGLFGLAAAGVLARRRRTA